MNGCSKPIKNHLKRFFQLEGEVIISAAFKKLSNAQIRVYCAFRLKEPFTMKGKGSQRKRFSTGEPFTYPYKAALKDLGIASPSTFREAIVRLVEVGFVDIYQSGSALRWEENLYLISSRWRKYGTSAYIPKKTPKSTTLAGFDRQKKSPPKKPTTNIRSNSLQRSVAIPGKAGFDPTTNVRIGEMTALSDLIPKIRDI